MRIEFFVPGEAKGEPRHESKAVEVKKGIWKAIQHPSHKADDWKQIVSLYAKRHSPRQPLQGPVRVDLVIVFPRPKYMQEGRKHSPERIPFTPKPDRDNIDKLILDQLTKLRFWKDDAQVFDGRITKFYQALQGDPPGIKVTIEAEPLPFFEN